MSDAGKWVQPLFPEEEIPFILLALSRCLITLKKTKIRELETTLNKRLRVSLQRDAQLRDRPIEVDREKVLDDFETGAESRLDITFTFSTQRQKPWPYFAIEAKRLRVSYKGKVYSQTSKYVTDRQGMMCFLDGRYSKGLTSAAMLGYVFDGNIAKARDEISKQIRENQVKLKCRRSGELKESKLAIAGVDESLHDFGDRHFTLFHILSAV